MGAAESALHLAVKTLLERHKKLLLPDCYAFYTPNASSTNVRYVRNDPRDKRHPSLPFDRAHPNSGIGYLPGKLVKFEQIKAEKAEGEIRPDLIAYIGEIPLYIEVAVTHFVDDIKLAKLRERGVSTLELIFSDIYKQGWTWTMLEERLFTESYGKIWLLNRKADQLAFADQKARVERIGPVLAEEAQRKQTHAYLFMTGDFRYATPRLVHHMRFILSLKHLEIQITGDMEAEPAMTLLALLRKKDAVYKPADGDWYLPPNYQNMLALAAEFKIAISSYYPRITVQCPVERQYIEMCHAVKIASHRRMAF